MSKSLGKSAVILTASKIITTFITLISAMLLARFRTLEEYGTYSQLLMVITLATALFTLGLPNSTNYFLARAETHDERQNFLSVYFSLNTLLCFIMGGALVLIIPLLIQYFNNELIKEYSYFLLLYPWAYVIIGNISNILVVYGKTTKLMLFSIVSTAVALISILIVQILGWSFREYMIIFLVGNLLLMIWVYIMVWNLEKPLRISFSKPLIIKILKYSIPIGLAGLVGTVSIEIDKLMIGRFFNTEQLAIYTNAAKELPLSIVASSLTAVLLPQMARMLKNNEGKAAVSLWGSTVLLSYMIICFFSMALVVFAPQVITILYSEKYLPGVTVFRVYSLVLLLRCTYFGMVLNSIGKTKLIFYSSLASLGLNVILNYTMYLLFGMVGPAIATFLSIGLVGFAQLYVTAKEMKVPFRELMPWKRLFIVTLLNIALGIIIYFITRILSLGTDNGGILISISIGLIATIIYLLILYKPGRLLWKEINNVS